MNTLSVIGEQFRAALSSAHAYRKRAQQQQAKMDKVHVVGAGATLTSAYEQLRNAAENTEEHLLLQNAIKRFYHQLLLARSHKDLATSGDELAVELTLAGYLPNDSISAETVATINKHAVALGELYTSLKQRSGIGHDKALRWTLDVLSVTVERELSDHSDNDVFLQFCYEHFRATIEPQKVFTEVPSSYDIALFMAVHRALLRSDLAVIRADLLRRYQVPTSDSARFAELSAHIDTVHASTVFDKLYRLVDRRAAPERIVRRMLQEGVDVPKLLENKSQFLKAYEVQVEREYDQVSSRIKRAIVRSIIFLFITKVIIGVAIEVPYDYAVHGEIIWLPLIVNLLFPAVYMALLSLTLGTPGRANTQALIKRIGSVLYGGDAQRELHASPARTSKVFSVGYSVFGLGLIGLISWGLFAIGYSALHLVIFFVFLSTASFLGFRLSHLIRELEVIRSQQSGLTFIRDLLYLPFVVIGRWLSEKYAQVNIVTLVLDMAIELPLKTVLRLVRQWGAFIAAKKDEL